MAATATEDDKNMELVHKDMQEMLENDLNCPICHDIYINPLILNCSHSFCKFCLYRWLSKQPGCPQCRTNVSFQAENLALRDIINRMVQKAAPQFKQTRTQSVNQRLKDEEEQEKDGVSKALIKANRNNRAFRAGDHASSPLYSFQGGDFEEPNNGWASPLSINAQVALWSDFSASDHSDAEASGADNESMDESDDPTYEAEGTISYQSDDSDDTDEEMVEEDLSDSESDSESSTTSVHSDPPDAAASTDDDMVFLNETSSSDDSDGDGDGDGDEELNDSNGSMNYVADLPNFASEYATTSEESSEEDEADPYSNIWSISSRYSDESTIEYGSPDSDPRDRGLPDDWPWWLPEHHESYSYTGQGWDLYEGILEHRRQMFEAFLHSPF